MTNDINGEHPPYPLNVGEALQSLLSASEPAAVRATGRRRHATFSPMGRVVDSSVPWFPLYNPAALVFH